MSDALVERQKDCARFRFHHGAIGWIARKSLDGIHRLPEGQDGDLNHVTTRATEHEGSAMTTNATKLWNESVLEERNISVGAVRGCEGRPRANHSQFFILLHVSTSGTADAGAEDPVRARQPCALLLATNSTDFALLLLSRRKVPATPRHRPVGTKEPSGASILYPSHVQ